MKSVWIVLRSYILHRELYNETMKYMIFFLHIRLLCGIAANVKQIITAQKEIIISRTHRLYICICNINQII